MQTLDPQKARRLAAILDSVAAAADRVRPFARFMTLLALASGVGLGLELRHFAGLAPWSTAIWFAILLVPALILAWLWWLLSDLRDLPEQARHVLGSLRDVGSPKPEPAAAAASAPGSVSGIFRLGGSLREAFSLATDAGSLAGVIASALLLANPLFLLALAVSLAAAPVLALIAAVTGLFLL